MTTFDLRFTINRGAFERHVAITSDARVIALTGASGSGKTSVLHAIAGLVRPTQGRIEIDGAVLFDSASRIDVAAHRRRIGYLFQDVRLFPHLDVRGNLLYSARARSGDAAPLTLDHVTDLLGIAPLLERRTQGLSGGEAQRVAMGRALLSQPRVLLLDEPLSMLDQDRRDELLPYLQRVRDEARIPMVYVSHVPAEVARMAPPCDHHAVGGSIHT